MSEPRDPPRWPMTFDLPASPAWRHRVRALRPAAYVLLGTVLAVTWAQYQYRQGRDVRRADRAVQAAEKALSRWRQNPDDSRAAEEARAALAAAGAIDRTVGAIPRWTIAVRRFWAGENIYGPHPQVERGDPLTGQPLAPLPETPTWPVPPDSIEEALRSPIFLHPNMPFVVVLLTPLAWLPLSAVVAIVCALKVAVLALAVIACAKVANHRDHRMGDWVMGWAVLMTLPLIISDLQHGNTNLFVLGAIAGHLWLYRRGRDAWAGGVLALGVCLKLTPILFGLYWLYQRNWRLLGGLVAGLAILAVLVPLAAMGPDRYEQSVGDWMNNLIVPSAVGGVPFPDHINQSLPGVFVRLFMHGNIYFNPDDSPTADKFEYINFVSLSPAAGRAVLTALRAIVVALMAWAIGWRKLPRDDGRRMLHYGLIVTGMLILNQRSWDHHAAVLLVAHAGMWYGIIYGRMRSSVRLACLTLATVAMVLVLAMGKDLFRLLAPGDPERAKRLAAVVEAYGPTFAHFVLVFAACVILLRALRPARTGDEPYGTARQELRRMNGECGVIRSTSRP